MKIFGTLREIVAAVFRKDSQEITLKPNDGTYTGAVEVKLPPKLSTGAAVLVAEDVQQTLTNKVLSGGVIRDNSRLVDAEVRQEGTAGGTPKLKFYKDGAAFKISMSAPVGLGSDYDFILPNTAGTPGTKYALANANGDGTTSWVRYDATNTGSALVQRDALGDFSANVITASLTGNVTGNVSGTAANVTGTVAIANGGTGQTTQQAALTALAGTQVSGQYLRSNGTNTLLSAIQAADVPTLNQNTTGTAANITATSNNTLTTLSSLSLPGSQVSGNISGNAANVTGTVAIGNGGTGQTTANAALNALLPSQGSSANKYLKTDGTNTSWASASGGAGEINAVLNSSGADGTTGWTGTSVVTGSNSPLNPIVTTAFSISNAATTESSTSGGYYPFTLPTGLQNRKLKVEFSYTTPATDVYKVSVYKGSTRVALTTDTGSPASTSLPASVTGGKFTAYFDTDNSSSWTVSITRTSGSTGPIYVTNVIVGPGIQPQGAVVGEWQSYTGTISGGGTATFTYVNRQWRRVGSNIEIYYVFSVTAAGSGTSRIRLPLPPGLNINLTAATNETIVGEFARYTGTVYEATSELRIDSTNTSSLIFNKVGTNTQFVGTDLNNGSTFYAKATVPIAEWAGSGTVQLAQNDVEYAASTNGTWDADSTAAQTIYGPAGAPITGALSIERGKVVRFQTPIQPGDRITLEMSRDQIRWSDVSLFSAPGGYRVINQMSNTAGNLSGAYITIDNATDVSVKFVRYMCAASDDAPTVDWINGTYWRVRKSSAGAAVGFGLYQPGVSAGLVSSSGLAGRADGQAVPSGYVGENTPTVTSSGNATFSSGSAQNLVQLTSLPAGVWMLYASVEFLNSSAIVAGGVAFSITTTSSTVSSFPDYNTTRIWSALSNTQSSFAASTAPLYINSLTSTGPYYVTAQLLGYSSGSCVGRARLLAVRIA